MTKELKECLVCGNQFLKKHLDLGIMPLVNNLTECIKYPLLVNECSVCTHRQLSISVDRELLYSDYLYQTGTSASHREFFRDFVGDLKATEGKVLDIGCNDASLLLEFDRYGWWECVGIEPAKKLYQEEKNTNLKVINDFFPSSKIKGKFDIITAFNVFAHNDNPGQFLIEMKKLLKEDGRIYILTTPARLDNYYHEHISYFNLRSMMTLVNICSLELKSFKNVSMHGESQLFEIGFKNKEQEIQGIGYFSPVVGYGASASEIVLFNYHKIKPEYVVDDNELKQGKSIPGINSPIVSCETLKNDKRDLNIIVAHNLFDEIVAKIKKLRPKRKDKFVRIV